MCTATRIARATEQVHPVNVDRNDFEQYHNLYKKFRNYPRRLFEYLGMEIETLLENTKFFRPFIFHCYAVDVKAPHLSSDTYIAGLGSVLSLSQCLVLGHETNINARSGIRNSNLNNQDKTFATDRTATGTGINTIYIVY